MGAGVKNVGIYLVKRRQRGKEGGHKIGKNGPTSFMDGPLVQMAEYDFSLKFRNVY